MYSQQQSHQLTPCLWFFGHRIWHILGQQSMKIFGFIVVLITNMINLSTGRIEKDPRERRSPS